MEFRTKHFGTLHIGPGDELVFAHGLIGFDDCRRWALVEDPQAGSLAWMQSLDDQSLALGVASPRRFVADYQIGVCRRDLATIGLSTPQTAQVLALVSRHNDSVSMNLRAPLLINPQLRLGYQVVGSEAHSL
ncbi:MAG: flagellar assembly protein FliW, partial [Planctomycetota bacterium]